MKTNARGWCMATAVVALTGCSSESPGEAVLGAEQALGANEFALINEIELNAPGGNVPWQYIELEGTPAAALSGLQLVVIDGGNPARVELVVNLGTACDGVCAIGNNGIFMIKAANSGAGEVGHVAPAGTRVLKIAPLSVPPGLTQTDTAVLLVQGATLLAEGAVVGRGDGGTAVLPAGDTLVDGVGWGGGGALAGVTLAQTTGVPDAATRFPGRRDRVAAAWYAGNLAGPGQSSVIYASQAAQHTMPFPTDGALTPGAPNVPQVDEAGVDAGDAQGDTSDAAQEATVDAPPDVPADHAADDVIADKDVVTVDAGPDAQPDAQGDGKVDDARADARDAQSGDAADSTGAGGAGGTGGAAGTGGTGGAAGTGGTGGAAGTGGTGGTAGGGTAGTGGTDGTAGTAGTGGTTGTGGTGGATGAGGKSIGSAGSAGSSVTPPPGDDGGCGCRLAAQSSGSRGGAFALLGLAALFSARRKNRAR